MSDGGSFPWLTATARGSGRWGAGDRGSPGGGVLARHETPCFVQGRQGRQHRHTQKLATLPPPRC